MNQISDFVNNMTLWNWIALAGFLVLPFAALNAYFGLRDRFRDWRALRGQASLTKRLDELKQVYLLAEHADAKSSIFDLGTGIAFLILVSTVYIVLFLWLIYLRIVFGGGFKLESILLGAAIGPLSLRISSTA